MHGVCTDRTHPDRTDTFLGANVCSMSLEERPDDPLLRFLDSAPLDDEPETDEERAAVAEVEVDRAAVSRQSLFDEIRRAYSDS